MCARSENEKTAKNAVVKITPLIVATSFVMKFTTAANASTRKISPIPSGTSYLPILKFKGTSYSRCCGSLNRSTSIASALNTKLQTTPKAYASPSVSTLPRLAMIVNSCRYTTRLMIRYVVPYFGCGFKNESGITPSSETRFNTPLEPTIAVFTAPERIRNPTPTTRAFSASRAQSGPTTFIARPPIRLPLYRLIRRLSGMIMTAKKLISEVNSRL